MSSTTKKKQGLNTVSVDLGCHCRRLKRSSFFNPKPKSTNKPQKYQKHPNLNDPSSTHSSTTTTTYDKYGNDSTYMDMTITSSSSSSVDTYGGRVGPKSVAVEKESNDPYLDFRQSMLQMIVENEIYCKDDLKELLNCFLQLNSASLHGVIIRVFTEIWNGFYVNNVNGKPNYYYSPRF